jgi:hypothetical protein
MDLSILRMGIFNPAGQEAWRTRVGTLTGTKAVLTIVRRAVLE